ncbi:MAG TPA: dihydrolipoamide acetyltransferase family protein, partial [Rhodoglobus sp.]|nr:dihydrolipoamide acetyltransferase family protein [Rhodoglobus sp.]
MATVVRMPAALAGVTEGAIQTWLVQPGQAVEIGAPLAEIETEKAVVEYAAEAEGTVLKLLVQEGVAVNVGDPIAVLGAEGESADDPADAPEQPAPSTPETAPPAPEPETAPEPGPPATAPDVPAQSASAEPVRDGDRLFASPIVRRLARERGIDLAGLTGSGPNGRIVRRDLDGVRATPAPVPQPAPAPVAEPATATDDGYDVPHTMMRKAIARRLTESKSTVPHFYVVADCRADALLALRKQINESSSVKISVNDLVLKACAAAFVDVPEANATWGESAVRRYAHVDIGVAVAIEGGLVTPVIRAVETMSLSQIAAAVADLAGRAREGKLRQHELEGGAFAVSNLGMYGITEFSAIINPPQAGILAVGAARQQPVVVDGALAVGSVMTVT